MDKPQEMLGAQHFSPAHEVKSVRVVDDRGQSLDADVRDDGTVSIRIVGKGIPGTADEVSTCQILVSRLNREEHQWADAEKWPEDQPEIGVDAVAKHLREPRELHFQVTRIDPDLKLWTDLGRTGMGREDLPIRRCHRGCALRVGQQEAPWAARRHYLSSERNPASHRSPCRTRCLPEASWSVAPGIEVRRSVDRGDLQRRRVDVPSVQEGFLVG